MNSAVLLTGLNLLLHSVPIESPTHPQHKPNPIWDRDVFKFLNSVQIVVSGLPTWQDLPPSLHTGVREGSADILLSVYLTQYYLEKMELGLCILMDDGCI